MFLSAFGPSNSVLSFLIGSSETLVAFFLCALGILWLPNLLSNSIFSISAIECRLSKSLSLRGSAILPSIFRESSYFGSIKEWIALFFNFNDLSGCKTENFSATLLSSLVLWVSNTLLYRLILFSLLSSSSRLNLVFSLSRLISILSPFSCTFEHT